MPVTQIPPSSPAPPPTQRDLFEAEHWESAYRGFNPDAVPHLLIQLQDDLSRQRKREALWLSVILHLLIVILLWNSEKLMMLLPHRTVALAIPAKIDRDKDATYLELPPDAQKLTRRPDAKVLSDKDRIATSKAPQIDRNELRKILQSERPGRPGEQAPQPQMQPSAPQQPSHTAQQSPPPQPNPQQNNNSGLVAPAQNPQIAQMRVPPQGSTQAPNFNSAMTAGSAIQQAAQAAAANRGRYGGGEGGDFGLSRGKNGAKVLDQAEVLTDTLGWDYSSYLARVVSVVRRSWYDQMPPSVYAPIFKQGKLAIEFYILPSGKIAGLQVDASSGDTALDRAAWGSITESNPFPPLPKEFTSRCASPASDTNCNFGLRFFYFYNMEVSDLK
jgi:TonB family protein